MVEQMELEIRQMEEDMQDQMSESPSVKSRAQRILDEVMAEEEEKMSISQTGRDAAGDDDDEEEEEEDSDDEGNNVFYKSSDLIYQPKSTMR